MKNLYQMFKLFPLFLLLFSLSLNAQGPDEYGYTWKDSNDPDGPTFNWVDISTSGTQVTGLSDDNSVAFVDMGLDFHYYWSDFDQIKIGSNGWLSFNNVANISHCFPPLPQAGGNGDNLVCPLMSDLNFAGSNNPGRIYYQNDNNERFIVSYHNVPFWVNANPMYTGDNTFQVIFNTLDTSITFQYLLVDAAPANATTCAQDVSIGIENITGEIGLSVLADAMPPSSYAIRFEYPEEVTFSVPDASPAWNQNETNGGEFYLQGMDIDLSASITNTGNADIDSEISIDATMTNPGGAFVYTDNTTLSGLAAGASADVSFVSPSLDLAPAQYAFNTVTTNSDDLNPNNNQNTSEIIVLDTSGNDVVLTYASDGANDGFIDWGSGAGSGAGIYIEPPAYPTEIFGVDAFIVAGSTDGFSIQILDDDGPNGMPGTVLASFDMAPEFMVAGDWNVVPVEATITEGGFYVAWLQGGITVGLGTEFAGPISNRTFEILSNEWAVYRESTARDFFLRVRVINDFIINDLDEVILQEQISIYPNPTNGIVKLNNNLENHTIDAIQVFNNFGQEVHSEKVNILSNSNRVFDFSQFAKGMYHMNLQIGKQMITKRIVIH